MAIERQKRPLVRDRGEFRDATLFIVATEGAETEPLYFGIFAAPRLKIVTLGCENGHSSPAGVLNRISEYKGKYQFGSGDTFWLVVDRDRWTQKMFAEVYAECGRKDFTLLVSNPRFEIWLAYHSDQKIPADVSKKNLRKHLVAVLGSFKKTQLPLESLKAEAPAACARARAADTGTNGIWPDEPGSRVYQLVGEILAKMS